MAGWIAFLLAVALSSLAFALSGYAGGWLQLFVILSALAFTCLGWLLFARWTRSRTRGRER